MAVACYVFNVLTKWPGSRGFFCIGNVRAEDFPQRGRVWRITMVSRKYGKFKLLCDTWGKRMEAQMRDGKWDDVCPECQEGDKK
jgi:hypothetical protein